MKTLSHFPEQTVDILLEQLATEADIPEAELRTRFANPDTTMDEAGIDCLATANLLFYLRHFFQVEVPRPENGEYGSYRLTDILTAASEPL